MPKYSLDDLREKTEQVKKSCLEMCIKAGMGHVTSAFSCAEIVVALYYQVMRYDIKNPNWDGRDRFIMGKNHGSIITYPVLADLGFFEPALIDTFLSDGSPLGIHTKRNLPGIEFSGGSLGIGLGVAVGLAYGAKMSRQNWFTFALVGDGECYEGSVWEAAMLAGHHHLNNLIVIVDRNNMCITDFTESTLQLEPFVKKWEAFQWEVKQVNGHEIGEILECLETIRKYPRNKPLCIIADTVKGNGIPFMENQPLYHGATPKGEAAKLATIQLAQRGENKWE